MKNKMLGQNDDWQMRMYRSPTDPRNALMYCILYYPDFTSNSILNKTFYSHLSKVEVIFNSGVFCTKK